MSNNLHHINALCKEKKESTNWLVGKILHLLLIQFNSTYNNKVSRL